MRAGAVPAILTDTFVKQLAAQGLRVRKYRVPHNGSVHCTVAPDDDLLIARLAAPLTGGERLDLERSSGEGSVLERLRDVPFDAATGEGSSRQQWNASVRCSHRPFECGFLHLRRRASGSSASTPFTTRRIERKSLRVEEEEGGRPWAAALWRQCGAIGA